MHRIVFIVWGSVFINQDYRTLISSSIQSRMNEISDLLALIKSRTPIIVIESRDELRVVNLLAQTASKAGLPIYKWNVVDGLSRVGGEEQNSNREPLEVIRHVWTLKLSGIYVLLDFHPFLNDPVHVRLIKEICLSAQRYRQTLILVSHEVKIPPELEHFTARFELKLPDEAMLTQIVAEVASQWAQDQPGSRVAGNAEALKLLVANLRGLSITEASRLARVAIYNDGAITAADLPSITKAKYQLLSHDHLLSYEYDTAHFSDIGGLDRFKKWLQQREAVFKGIQTLPGINPPKGVLLLGVQGSGKSLAAKSVAGTWGIPLLRLDFGSLYDKYFGETERRTREALKLAENMSPCVLWMDEIEKGISTGDSDQGTSRRVLGTLLTWMSERQTRVFLVATANDIEKLPAELLRKGRFDEIFFVDLPDKEIRKVIFSIHLKKRGFDPEVFDLDTLAVASEGFSGSEIEQAIVSALYSVLSSPGTFDTKQLLAEILDTRPLSVIMSEQVNALRSWAQDRTVPAS